LEEIKRTVCERREYKNGKRNILKGKMVVSILEVLEELKKCEVEVNIKRLSRDTEGQGIK